ncbi:MAG TPA: TonB family protein [Nitrospiraceae bacterium]|nr:TonB family protein [Nitrospiraceae bacterium]
MSVGTYPEMSLTAYGGQSSTGRYMQVMVGLSLALHVMALLLIAGLRLPSKMEHPLAAYQVSLVTLPTPPSEEPKPISQPINPEPPKTLEPPKTPEPPKTLEPPVARSTRQVAKEAPSLPPQPVRLAPTPHVRTLEPILTKPTPAAPTPKIRQETTPAPPVPVPAPVPPGPIMRQSEAKPVSAPVPPPPRPALTRDVLRGMAQPDVPKLGQMNQIPAGTPKETRSQTQTDVQKILNNLTVPESMPIVSQPITPQPIAPQPIAPQPVAPQPMRSTPPRSSMSEEVNRQLQKLEQAPPPPKVEPVKTPVTAEPQVASKPPAARMPITTLQATGVAAGNPYIALVQRKISEHWSAPQVGAINDQFQVIVKFRLDKTGQVSGVVVERPSGNEYYDLAALRAIRTAILPSFPPDMTQAYFDAHFSFAVGEPVS